MNHIWHVLLILLYLQQSSCLKCNPYDKNCLCLPGAQFEFQCPHDSGAEGTYVIHITDQEDILIDCSLNIQEFDISLLPNVTVEKVERFRMRFCPLPPRNFKQVLDSFGVKEVKLLQFTNSELSNQTLTKDYFEGLEGLESLQLNDNGLVELEDDVFANTPNLQSLELQVNRLKLSPNLFENTPLLKSLDISQNELYFVPEGLFQNLSHLELLHMWGNNLQEIDDVIFESLHNLRSLELSSNKIETVSVNSFENLKNLERINFSMNKLQTLPSDLFSNNKKLKLVIMKYNGNLSLTNYLFSNISSLGEVDLSNCGLHTVPENLFEDSDGLKKIKLNHNKLQLLPDNLFKGLKNLVELYLENNRIEAIDNVFASLKQLKILALQNNQIKEIKSSAFEDLTSLEKINLTKNQIVYISHKAFYKNDNLKVIGLSHNQYAGDSKSGLILLENAANSEIIDLSHNLITQIDDVIILYNKVNLRSLDLSYNRINVVYLKDLQPLAKKITINLEHNNITEVRFDYVEAITTGGEPKDALRNHDPLHSEISLNGNPLNCDCHNFDLIKYVRDELRPEIKVTFDLQMKDLTCSSPPELQNMSIETLPPQLLICPVKKGCPEECDCSQRPFDESIIIDCSQKNLTDYPHIDFNEVTSFPLSQTEMHLEGNFLNVGPNKSLTGYDNITRLYLSFNEIESISWLPPRLKLLKLDNNKLHHLNYEVLKKMTELNLQNLTLDNNPWSCDCRAENFTKFLRQNTKMVDARNVYCFNSTKLLFELNRTDLCHEFPITYIILIILAIFFIIASITALYYRYQQEIKVWLYAHNMCLWWVTEEELDKDKIYDAFISYSHKDEDFVSENLLPVLEGGPQPYKLCLHYRNWIPGEFITTQVTNSVLESRRTLVVLSPNFLESVWGKMEFRTAHTQAMTEGRARVIIVLYGDIDMESLDDELKTYLKTNTYVKWGDPYFWNKLKYALPHSKRGVANNHKMANVMNCIDDKFKLVAPVPNSPGSTPPVLALDPTMLKKHPLNFVSRSSQEIDTPPAEGALLVSTGL